MVGGTLFRYFKDKDQKVWGTDLIDEKDKEKVMKADVIFVCVPTPFKWRAKKGKKTGFDLSIVKSVLSEIPDGKVVVIKSTMLIGSTESLQKKFHKLKLLFNPEFLSEKTCNEDFRNPDRQFVGYTKQSYGEAIKVFEHTPRKFL